MQHLVKKDESDHNLGNLRVVKPAADGDGPVKRHSHWDHSWGNQEFPESTIIGHSNCRAEMVVPGSVVAVAASSSGNRINLWRTTSSAMRQPCGRRLPPGSRQLWRELY